MILPAGVSLSDVGRFDHKLASWRKLELALGKRYRTEQPSERQKVRSLLELGRLVHQEFIAREKERVPFSRLEKQQVDELVKDLSGLKAPSTPKPGLERLLSELEAKGVEMRKSRIRDRLSVALAEVIKADGMVVFDTLTVTDQAMEAVTMRDSNAWRCYKQKVLRKFGPAEYCCVVEYGEKYGRYHLHVLWFFHHDINVADPNAGRKIPNYREIKEFCGLWEHGISSARFCRWSGDYLSRKGFAWPVERKNGKWEPIKGDPGALVHYLAGYIQKQEKDANGCPYRTRMSRNLGTKTLRQMVQSLSNQALDDLATAPTNLSDVGSKLLEALRITETARRVVQLPNYTRSAVLESATAPNFLVHCSTILTSSASWIASIPQSFGKLSPDCPKATSEARRECYQIYLYLWELEKCLKRKLTGTCSEGPRL